MLALLLALALSGCGAVERHEADKAQEARLAAIEQKLDRLTELVAIVTDAVARARRSIEQAAKALGGR